MDLNITILEGRVGSPPQCRRKTEEEQACCSFVVGVGEQRISKTEKSPKPTEWWKIVAWGSLAEWCVKNVKRGKLVRVIGKLTQRKWDGPRGQGRTETEIQAKEIYAF